MKQLHQTTSDLTCCQTADTLDKYVCFLFHWNFFHELTKLWSASQQARCIEAGPNPDTLYQVYCTKLRNNLETTKFTLASLIQTYWKLLQQIFQVLDSIDEKDSCTLGGTLAVLSLQKIWNSVAGMDNHCGFAQFLQPWQCSHWDANHRLCFSCATCTSAVDIDMLAHVLIVVMVSSRCLWFEKSLDRTCTSDLVQASWHESSNSTSRAVAHGTKVTWVLPTRLCKANIAWRKVADFLYACSRVPMIAHHTILFSQSLNRFSLCHFRASQLLWAFHQTTSKTTQTFAFLQWSLLGLLVDHLADVKVGSASLSRHVTNHMCWLLRHRHLKQRQHEYQIQTRNGNTSSMTQKQISNSNSIDGNINRVFDLSDLNQQPAFASCLRKMPLKTNHLKLNEDQVWQNSFWHQTSTDDSLKWSMVGH